MASPPPHEPAAMGLDLMTMDALCAIVDRMDRNDPLTAVSFEQAYPRMVAAMEKAFWGRVWIIVGLIFTQKYMCDCQLYCDCMIIDKYNDNASCYIRHGNFSCISQCPVCILTINGRLASMQQLKALKQKGVRGCTVVFDLCGYVSDQSLVTPYELENIASHCLPFRPIYPQSATNISVSPVSAIHGRGVYYGGASVDVAIARILLEHKETLITFHLSMLWSVWGNCSVQPAQATLDALLNNYLKRLDSFEAFTEPVCYYNHGYANFLGEAKIGHFIINDYHLLYRFNSPVLFQPADFSMDPQMRALVDRSTTSLGYMDHFADIAASSLPHICEIHFLCCWPQEFPVAADMAAMSAAYPNLVRLHISISARDIASGNGINLNPTARLFLQTLSTMPAQRYEVHVFIYPRVQQPDRNSMLWWRLLVLDALSPHYVVMQPTVAFTETVQLLSNRVQLTWIAENSDVHRHHPCRRCDLDDLYFGYPDDFIRLLP